MLNLRDEIEVKHDGRWKSDKIIARSFDQPPRYDTLLDNGKELSNIDDGVRELGCAETSDQRTNETPDG